MVTRIFDQQGLAYTAAIVEQAEELMKKTPEMRSELASVLDITQSVLAEDDGDEDDKEGKDSDEATVLSAAKPLSETASEALKKEKSKSSSQGNGRKSTIATILGDDTDLFV
jgi:hypothetical protein